jgi:hypothetical protein
LNELEEMDGLEELDDLEELDEPTRSGQCNPGSRAWHVTRAACPATSVLT